MSLLFLAIALVERVVEEEEGCEVAFLIQSGVLVLQWLWFPNEFWDIGNWIQLLPNFETNLYFSMWHAKDLFWVVRKQFYKTWLKLWLLAFRKALFIYYAVAYPAHVVFVLWVIKKWRKSTEATKSQIIFINHNTSMPFFCFVVGSVIS